MRNHGQAHDRASVVDRHQRRKFRQLAEQGAVGAVDRFGMEIAVGDLVIAELGTAPIFQVVAVTPNLHPNAPPGTITVVLTATIPVQTRANAPVQSVVVVRPMEMTVEEDGGHDDPPGT